jgi:hypothetical protein
LRDAPVVSAPEKPITPRSSFWGGKVGGGWTKRSAAFKITASARGRLQRKQWAKARRASLILTSAARGHLARNRARDQRDALRRALVVIALGVQHWRLRLRASAAAPVPSHSGSVALKEAADRVRKLRSFAQGDSSNTAAQASLTTSKPRRSRAAERTMRRVALSKSAGQSLWHESSLGDRGNGAHYNDRV